MYALSWTLTHINWHNSGVALEMMVVRKQESRAASDAGDVTTFSSVNGIGQKWYPKRPYISPPLPLPRCKSIKSRDGTRLITPSVDVTCPLVQQTLPCFVRCTLGLNGASVKIKGSTVLGKKF